MKHSILTTLLTVFCLLCGMQTLHAQGKQAISVLYVGGSADMETFTVDGLDSVAVAKSVKARMASFEKFLKARFKTVKVVNGPDYTADMSNDYDVTVFDGHPNELRPLIMERDEQGRVTRYERAAYLPDDFDRPALCIAGASEEIGRSIGTKNDWFCLCLAGDALGWKPDHPIFQGPFKVNIKTGMKPTPSTAFEYGKIYGYTLPEETEMWTVQSKDYINDQSYRIGMVSRPWGYLDSPETEIISGGVSGKSIDAVAIGRHANFLHWGFSASPTYLTEAGKAALANAIVYISQFAGQHVIARKLNESIATRDNVDVQKYLASKDAWQESMAEMRQFYITMDSIQQIAKAKVEQGEELSSLEKMYINVPLEQRKEPTYAEYLKQRYPNLYHIFGDDADEYARFYEKNRGWFHPDETGYDLDIDEEVRTLGIANNDIRLLDTCITMLEQGENVELATSVLQRYTLCRFTTPTEWRNWYDTYKEQLFFTESGGWLWLVNTMDRTVPGNDYSVLKSEEKAEAEAPALQAETDKQNPVALSATVNTLENGNRELVIRMKIHDGYHTYAHVSDADPYIATDIQIELPEGCSMEGDMTIPAFTSLAGTETTVYTGECLFRQQIAGQGTGEATCTVTYQCCDNSICFPPETKTLTVTLP